MVQRLAFKAQLGHVVGNQLLQPGLGIAAGDVDHGHVGHIEHAGVAAHDLMFLQLGAVMDGHFPTGEINHRGRRRHERQTGVRFGAVICASLQRGVLPVLVQHPSVLTPEIFRRAFSAAVSPFGGCLMGSALQSKADT
jgi:hypothetical protein